MMTLRVVALLCVLACLVGCDLVGTGSGSNLQKVCESNGGTWNQDTPENQCARK